MSDWYDTELGNVCSFRAGTAFPTDFQGGRSGEYPFIKVSDLSIAGNELFVREANNWVSRATAEELKAKPVRAGSVVFAKIGEGLKSERVRLTTMPTLLDNNLMAAIPGESLNPRFSLYLFATVGLSSWAAGSALPYLRQGDLARIPIRLPHLDEQRRIAEVLGALDDLIDTNERTISALGHTADHIFETFDPITHTSTFAEVVDIFGGGTPSTSDSDYWGGDVRWATPTDLTALSSPYLFDTAKKITDAGLAACSSRLHPKGAILMTSRATIGRIAVAQQPTATNQGFIVLAPRSEADRWFLFHELRVRVDEFISRANGSTFLEISRGTFKGLNVGWPSVEDRRRLHKLLAPLHEAAVDLELENAQLRRTRDELLPLLMSGAVRVRPEGVAA